MAEDNKIYTSRGTLSQESLNGISSMEIGRADLSVSGISKMAPISGTLPVTPVTQSAAPVEKVNK